ncbi:hypothetical protein P344_05585 [Spiroplasma mirum ATCC 29335]|uniref:DNA-directed DNA polymerase n=2 Tax=Spiroplasma mirum TaxID=2144 RepID=W0GMA9_9MOLU|nr:DNA polymerase III subunit alpha [Spiroplasma mirum]AHF61322.1 DNA polymerase III DnaE [Spiroplasma mirum ATCC 29335]AHI58436.1 hypothetical protein P344_05585 [Spiroplasma mirum ATCC 29335]AKM53374.1 DNA polymerase III subunit alpha [Spiroplasma atrichopogonis]
MAKMHLNVRTNYSLLSSLIGIDNYLAYGQTNGLPALAICDNNMYGVYEFHEKCCSHNITPIIGLNFYTYFNNQKYNLNLFAINQAGYFNLVKISSWIMTNNEKDNVIDFSTLLPFINDHLKIIINFEEVNYDVVFYQKLLTMLNNPDNLYLGLNNNNLMLLSFFKELVTNDKIIWNNKVLYFDNTDFNAYKIINAIKKQILFKESMVKDTFAFDNYSSEYEQYLDNISAFISNIQGYDLKHQNIHDNLLKYPTPENVASRDFLRGVCKKGMKYKLGSHVENKYLVRLKYELDIIDQMDFNDYFLIVWDYVNFAKKNNIYVGPGRGSAAGSLVSYLLDITTIDPVQENLIFERFLNPERQGMPDIDIDFQDDKREAVVEYLFEKYGQQHIAHIVTFQTSGMKMALRDVCRVFGISLEEADKMSKAVRLEDNYNFTNAFTNNNVLDFYSKKYPHIFLYLPKIVGLPRQTGTHAAGVVLSQKPLATVVPIREGYNGIYQTQYSMNYLEELGLLKMDLLGLRNLTILHNVINNIYQEIKVKINLQKIPLNDAKTFKLLSSGDTKGIFQLESPGMTKVLIEMQPDKLEDIVATSSLYRPGPQDNIPLYIQRKNHHVKFSYLDDRLKDILAPTYGIIVYQEQVMLIAQKVANFSLAKADILRRAMGKKESSYMNELKTEFLNNAVKNHYTPEIANDIWNLIYKFAAYGFNRSHAVAYSLLGYQMAYLKANYPSQFLASLLTNVIGDENKTADYIQLARKNNLGILPPSIILPLSTYVTRDDKICLPLLVIKQIGYAFYNKIAQEYHERGEFQDLYDIFIRLYKKGLNKKTYEALCYTGALDYLNFNRTTLFNNYNLLANYVEVIKVSENNEQLIINPHLAEKPEVVIFEDDVINNIKKEYEFLGFYLSNHPLKYIRTLGDYEQKTTLISDLKLSQGTTNILVIIKRVKEIFDKNNKKMAFVDCYDESGAISITVFANKYQQYAVLLKPNNVILLNIKLGSYQDKINGIMNRIKLITTENK